MLVRVDEGAHSACANGKRLQLGLDANDKHVHEVFLCQVAQISESERGTHTPNNFWVDLQAPPPVAPKPIKK